MADVAELPGIITVSYAMLDVHWGYGLPIGGAAATGVTRGGVVSPGRVGFDIAGGVRLLAAGVGRDDLIRVLGQCTDQPAASPCGTGRGGLWELHGQAELEKLLVGGAACAVARGHGSQPDPDRCEEGGAVNLAQASSRAADNRPSGRVQQAHLQQQRTGDDGFACRRFSGRHPCRGRRARPSNLRFCRDRVVLTW